MYIVMCYNWCRYVLLKCEGLFNKRLDWFEKELILAEMDHSAVCWPHQNRKVNRRK